MIESDDTAVTFPVTVHAAGTDDPAGAALAAVPEATAVPGEAGNWPFPKLASRVRRRGRRHPADREREPAIATATAMP